MLTTSAITGRLKEHGFTIFTGVPCSYLKGLINAAINKGLGLRLETRRDMTSVKKVRKFMRDYR